MRVHQIVSASLALLLAFPTFAQQQPPPRTYGETLEIRVVNVEVIVADRNGNPVTGLTKDDFEIFENGKRKDISNFLEINEPAQADARAAQGTTGAAAAPAASTERRHLLVFVDNTTLQPFNRNRVLAAMKGFVERTMRNGDEAMVVTWNPGLKEMQTMTTDRAQVLATLKAMSATTGQGSYLRVHREQTENELRQMVRDYQMQPTMTNNTGVTSGSTGDTEGGPREPGSVASRSARLNERPPYDRALGSVRNYAEAVMADTRQKAEALRALMAPFKGVQGRKVLIFVTESFSTQPARQMFEYLDSIKDGFDKGNFQNPRAEIMKYNDEPLFQTVTAMANASGVTLYAVSAAGMAGGIDMPDASSIGMTVQDRPVNKAPGKLAEQSLTELAAATGGLAVIGTNDFGAGFNKIAADLTMYYSLGYRADAPATDVARKLDVKVKKPGVVVRNRESFVQKATGTEIGETLAANLFAGVQKNDMNITISAGVPAPKSDTEITVPVEVRIPVTSLTLLPEGTDVVGKFSIYSGFTRSDGMTFKMSKAQYPLRFAADTLKDRRNVTVRIAMTLHKNTESISVGVLDETSNATGYATTKVTHESSK